MTTTQNTARVGLFFLLGLALIWVSYETLSDGKALKSRGYNLVAGFDNLKELKQGDDVRMAGVKIGAVQETRLTGRRAEAILRIDPAVQVANDAFATIGSAGLLGTNYIAIDLGTPSAPSLAPNAEINTKASADLNTIMTQLGELGNKLEGALGSIGEVFKGKDGQPSMFQRLDALLADNGEKVNKAMSNLQEITDKVNHGEGTLGKLVNDPKLHDDLLATVGELKNAASDARSFMTNAQTIVDQVKSGKGTLGALIYDETTGNEIRTVTANLKEVSDKLAKGEGTLGKLINDDSLFREAQSTLRKADRALDGLGDSGPITAVGVVAGALF
ncbi:MAG: MCE family protein [Opitutaceae bacterium]|nr:MCE family protein [Opitutaceae bacterium]